MNKFANLDCAKSQSSDGGTLLLLVPVSQMEGAIAEAE